MLIHVNFLGQPAGLILLGMKSSLTMNTQGTRMSMMTVANSTPKPRDTAIGIRNFACMSVSAIMGMIPTKVVSEVKRIARKRAVPAVAMA